jgi:hypothetical protein
VFAPFFFFFKREKIYSFFFFKRKILHNNKMCDNQSSFPLKNYHRGLVKSQIDVDTASPALYSERVMGLGDNCEMCTPGWQLTWDEYGRVVGTAGVKSAAAHNL